MLLKDDRSVMQKRWYGLKGGGELVAWFALHISVCVSLRCQLGGSFFFSWGSKTDKKSVQNAHEPFRCMLFANLKAKTSIWFCGSVMYGEFSVCQVYSCRRWVGILCLHLHYFCLQLTVEEVMTTTAYLDLFLRSVSEPALLKIFLRFILLHRHENVHILDTLTSRINTPFRVRRARRKFGYSAWMQVKYFNGRFYIFSWYLFNYESSPPRHPNVWFLLVCVSWHLTTTIRSW